jgi:hypothetical protein
MEGGGGERRLCEGLVFFPTPKGRRRPPPSPSLTRGVRYQFYPLQGTRRPIDPSEARPSLHWPSARMI